MNNISIARDYLALCKPKVVFLMLITTWVGMLLAMPSTVQWGPICWGTLGIALSASAAAVINHVLEPHIDKHMLRTRTRPIASGRVQAKPALVFAAIMATIGLGILLSHVNTITCILTFLTLIGYAVIYTRFLKRASPQNIVIGGLAGATPPLLGWTAVTGELHPHAWLLVLIIFTWTPSHFWALAVYRRHEYDKAGLPMLPVTHGTAFTKLCIVLYTLLMFPAVILPYLAGMSGLIYLAGALLLTVIYTGYAVALYWSKDDRLALRCFAFSIVYLFLLFILLLWDHYYLWVLI